MYENLPVLSVKMFGGERITYGEKAIFLGKNSVTKAAKLLLILIHSGKDGISRNKLLEDLYGREEILDAGNNLRVTVHRLKKMLGEEGLPEYEYIVSKGGYYRFNSPVKVEVDCLTFKGLLECAAFVSEDEKISLLRRACELYAGDFCQKMQNEEWVLIEGVQYKNLYTKALEELTRLYMERKEYDEVLKQVNKACELYPFDEWQSVKIDCYLAMNRYKDALKEYEDTAKMLVEELGISPSPKMMEQFQMMSKKINNRPQIIGEIKNSLQEDMKERGAFFCTVPGFRDAYRIARRGMERSGQSVYLMVCTLTDNHGRPMENSEKLERMSDALFDAIKNSLRRCDSFTKYNQAQYLVLLMGTNRENCQIVIDRITKAFSGEHKSWTSYLECNVESLYDYDGKMM